MLGMAPPRPLRRRRRSVCLAVQPGAVQGQAEALHGEHQVMPALQVVLQAAERGSGGGWGSCRVSTRPPATARISAQLGPSPGGAAQATVALHCRQSHALCARSPRRAYLHVQLRDERLIVLRPGGRIGEHLKSLPDLLEALRTAARLVRMVAAGRAAGEVRQLMRGGMRGGSG